MHAEGTGRPSPVSGSFSPSIVASPMSGQLLGPTGSSHRVKRRRLRGAEFEGGAVKKQPLVNSQGGWGGLGIPKAAAAMHEKPLGHTVTYVPGSSLVSCHPPSRSVPLFQAGTGTLWASGPPLRREGCVTVPWLSSKSRMGWHPGERKRATDGERSRRTDRQSKCTPRLGDLGTIFWTKRRVPEWGGGGCLLLGHSTGWTLTAAETLHPGWWSRQSDALPEAALPSAPGGTLSPSQEGGWLTELECRAQVQGRAFWVPPDAHAHVSTCVCTYVSVTDIYLGHVCT